MAGRAAPLRARRPEEREANGLGSDITYAAPLLANHPTAEAADGTRRCRSGVPGSGRREDSAAEILFETIRNILPELDHFRGRAAFRVDLHHRAAVDHRGSKVGAVVDGDGSNSAVLRESDGGFVGDLGFRGRRVDDENQGLAGTIAEIDSRADSTEIVRARAGRDDDQLGNGNDTLNGHGDGRRSVDDRQAETLLAENLKVGGKPRDSRLRKSGHFCLALVPPIGKAALRVDVDQADRAGPSQNAHAFPLAEAVNSAPGVALKALKSG